jgi:hypothetical protein
MAKRVYDDNYEMMMMMMTLYGSNDCGRKSWAVGKVKLNFTLEQVTKVPRGSRGIALLFL